MKMKLQRFASMLAERNNNLLADLPNLQSALLAIAFLAALTAIGFYLPMLKHWWVGYDEPVLLSMQTAWFDVYDKCCGRPLAGLEAFLGNQIMPGRIDVLPIVSAIDRWILASALYLLVISILPNAQVLAVASGILMVVSPTETIRFSPGLSVPYSGALMFLILAAASFVLSYNARSRALLILSCAFLAVSFLHYETTFPVSVLTPIMLWFRPARPHRLFWAASWYFTTLLLAIRFALFFMHGGTYQSSYSAGYSLSSFKYFPLLVEPILKYISPLYTGGAIFLAPILLGTVTLLFLVAFDKLPSAKSEHPSATKFVTTLGIAIAALVLTLIPEVSIPAALKAFPNFDGDLTMRLEFTPGPFQAVIWAASVGLLATISFRAQPQLFAAGIAVLVAGAALDSERLQAKNGTLNPYLSFQTVSDIFRRSADIIRSSPPESVIFFAIPDDKPSPLGAFYHPFHMSCLLFGLEAYAGHYSPDTGFLRRVGVYPSPLNQNDYEAMRSNNIVLIVVDDQNNVVKQDYVPTLASDKSPPARDGGPLGRCSIKMAKPMPDGDLPFLLPDSKR